MRWIGMLGCVAILSQCAPVNYEALPSGEFSGSLFVMWVGEGNGLGDGKFVFVPNPDTPLTFTRKAGAGTVSQIQPGLMYTDGGSIPKAGQVFKGFSPWGYAPAYMVHDWLFVARHCLKDGTATPEQAQAAVDFDESAEVLGEAIKTLVAARRVAPNDLAGSTITSVVKGPISRAIWNRDGECARQKVSDTDRAEVERAFPRRKLTALRQAMGEAEVRGTTPPGPAAQIVAEIAF